MPFIKDHPVARPTFMQIADSSCCQCKKLFRNDKAIDFEERNCERKFSFRVVFLINCDKPHFIHTQCFRKTIGSSKNISCYACEKLIEPAYKVHKILSEYSDVESACDRVHDLLKRLEHIRNEGLGVNFRKRSGYADWAVKHRKKLVELITIESVEKLATLRRFVDQEPVARKLGEKAIQQLQDVCYNRVYRLVHTGRFDEAIEWTKSLLPGCSNDIKDKLEEFWLCRCQDLELRSKSSVSDKLSCYREVREISFCFRKSKDIKQSFKAIVFSTANSLLKCPDGYEYDDFEIMCLKSARSHGRKKCGERVAEILLKKSKATLACQSNVDLGAINKAFVDLKYAEKYGAQRVKYELRTMGCTFFDSLGHERFDAMRKKAREIFASPTPDKVEIHKVKDWLALVFWYGTEEQKGGGRDLGWEACNL